MKNTVKINSVDLINADCLHFIQSLPDDSIDLIVTDPPYFKVKPNGWDNQWKGDEDYLQTHTDMPGSDNLNGINVKYRYEFTDTLGLVTSFSYANAKDEQKTHYSDTRWHEDSVRNRWFSMMAGPSVRVNEWFSAYAMAGMAYSRISTFSGDYLRVTDNKGKTHDVLTGSDDDRHSNTSLAWGAGVQFNPTESVAIDIAYEGSGSGDWRTDGFIVGVGYKF
ncbi:Ail/Lom family protein [Escherichia coli]|nr:Ail/Lom family protein [Escherichia coli]